MKTSLMLIFLVLSTSLYEAQGIRLEKLSASAKNHQELATKSSSVIQDDKFSATTTELSSGINRKLMTKTIPSSSTNAYNKNSKNDPRLNQKFTHGLVRKEEIFHTTSVSGNSKHEKTKSVSERYPDITDITGMDYSPAKKKPPIHN